MSHALAALAQDAKAWPFEQARALRARLERLGRLDGRVVLFETGYGPSGLPHIGTFGEVARTTMVRNAFRTLTGDTIPTKLLAFSDDMDGLRKVPPHLPNQAMLTEDLGKPLTAVRDPFGTHDSFAAHNNARLRAFLDDFEFDYEFASSTEYYRAGRFDQSLLTMLERFDAVQAVMLPSLGEERRASYSPFLPVSPTTGRVLQVPTLERNLSTGTIVFMDEDGTKKEVPVTGGHAKVQWKPDWAMRWTELNVDYEMSGKDLIDSVKLSNQICKILGGTPPEGFNYELFLDEANQKISKTKGNGLTMEDWLRYGAPESLGYYMFQSPKSAKRLYFDVIPKAADEYLQQLEAYPRQGPAQQLGNPVWHMHGGKPQQAGSPVSFSLLLNLVSAADASTKETLWGFLSRYIPGATPADFPILDRMAGYAINYYDDFVRPNKTFRAPSDQERAAMLDLRGRFVGLPTDADAETIQNAVFEAGKAAGFEPLRAWFTALYEVLLGQTTGPRFGSFAAIFGIERTIALIDEKLGA